MDRAINVKPILSIYCFVCLGEGEYTKADVMVMDGKEFKGFYCNSHNPLAADSVKFTEEE